MFYDRRFLAIIATLITIASASLFARGQQEDPIRQARELLADNRINEAILLLEQTVRDDPERILEAEALLRTIREIRGEYNVLFEELIDNLVNNPDDIERTLAIIDRMEELDEYPNERVVEQVRDARIVAQLAYDRTVIERVMEEARLLAEEARYTAAITRYLSLRELQRDRFEDRGYGDIFTDSVDRAVTQLLQVSQRFNELYPGYSSSGSRVLRTAEQDVLEITPEILLSFFEDAETMVAVLDDTRSVSNEIAVLKSQVPLQFPDEPVDWYLNFQDIMMRGRSEFRGNEGILRTIEVAYGTVIGDLTEAAAVQTQEIYRSGLQAVDGDRFAGAVTLLETGASTAELWERAESAGAGLFTVDPDIETILQETPEANAQNIIFARLSRLAAISLRDIAVSMEVLLENSRSRADTLLSLESQKASVEGIYSTLVNGRARWDETRAVFVDIPAAYRRDDFGDRLSGVDNRWTSAIRRVAATEADLAARLSIARTDGTEGTISEVTTVLEETEPLVQGVPAGATEEEDQEALVRLVRYPDDALTTFQTVAARLRGEIARIEDSREVLREDSPYIQELAPVQGEYDRLDGVQNRLQVALDRANQGIEEAQSLISRSEALIQEAQERIADARAAISQLQVTPARNNWNAAREAFVTAFDLREDPERRAEADALIQEVGLQIQEAENILVVRRVRELLILANDLYTQDQYVAARDTLLEAQQTWEQTNVERNTEIDRLLQLVTAALSLEEGRELTVTDPLYPVLGNYLSIAREDYNRGVDLYDNGATDRANVFFDRAIENLQNVRAVRPLNWEARLLELRISQIRNSDDFDEVFQARYEQAVSRIQEAGALQVYSELEVLAEINPDYPGIQDQIRRLEIALNLRPDPVSQAQIAEAQQLFARAQSLAASGSQDAIAVAVTLLEQAIQLNPSNGNAAFLLDQLRIQLGGQATVALSTADELQYRRAETLFSQGRVLQALAITERLLENPNNANYPPLVDLRRRIGLRLGI